MRGYLGYHGKTHLPPELAAIRAQAARNCGLAEYPAQMVADFEAIDFRPVCLQSQMRDAYREKYADLIAKAVRP